MMNQRYWPPQVPMNNPCGPAAPKTANTTNPPARPPDALEKHYSLAQVAEAWGLSYWTVRRIFRDMPGVPDFSARKTSLTSLPYKVLRIPASVAARVHEQRSAGFVLGKRKK